MYSKKIFILFVGFFFFTLSSCTNDSNNLSSTHEAHLDQDQEVRLRAESEPGIIVSKFYDKNSSRDIFLITTSEEGKYSVSILEEGKYVTTGFYSEQVGEFTIYDDKGTKITSGPLEKTIAEVNKEAIEGRQLPGLSKATSDGCLGGSTIGCFLTAWSACSDDFVCSLLCRASGWNCPAAILVACFIHCNT